MAIQAEVKTAIDGGRADLIEVLAEHRLLPEVIEGSGSGSGSDSGLLERSTPMISLEPQGEEAAAIDRQTSVHVADTLGLESEADCESVREAIRTHSAW